MVEEQPSAGPMDLGGLEKGEPSAFFKFLEMIAMYAFYVFLVVAAIVALLLIIKKTRDWVIKIFRTILTFLKNIVNRTTHQAEAEQYIDEKESVFNWDEWKEEQKNKAKGMMQKVFAREPRWEKLSNEQKVRYVYRKLVMQHKQNVHSAATPREILQELKSSSLDENLLEKLTEVYEYVRYGEKEIADEMVNDLRAFN